MDSWRFVSDLLQSILDNSSQLRINMQPPISNHVYIFPVDDFTKATLEFIGIRYSFFSVEL